MKRLKAVLSAVLALTIALSMAVVPAGAANVSFGDGMRMSVARAKVLTPTEVRIYQNGEQVSYSTDVFIPTGEETENVYTYTMKFFCADESEFTDLTPSATFVESAESDKQVTDSGDPCITLSETPSVTITIQKGATAGHSYYLYYGMFGYENLTGRLTIHVKSSESPAEEQPTINWSATANGTYGQTWAEIVDYSNSSAILGSTELSGTFEVVNGSMVPDIGDQYRLKFISSDGKYNVTSEPYSAQIAPKKLTVTADSAEKIYDGSALTANGYKADGLVGEDKIGALTVSGTRIDAGETANVPNGISIVNDHADKTKNYDITYVSGILKILPRSIEDAQITNINSSYEYRGTECRPAPIVKVSGKELSVGKDYSVAYENNQNCGEARVIITGQGNYAETAKVTFQITPKTLVAGEDYTITLPENAVYDGQAKTAAIWTQTGVGVVSILYDGEDKPPVDVGTYRVTAAIAEGKNYHASESIDCGSFSIAPRSLVVNTKNIIVTDKTYNGKSDDAQINGLTFDNLPEGVTLTEGKDYLLKAKYDSAEVGDQKVTVTVTLRNTNYTLEKDTFYTTGRIVSAPIPLTLQAKDAVYTGLPYDERNLTYTGATSLTYTYYTDINGAKGSRLAGAPTKVGTYWVEGHHAAEGTAAEATTEAVRFCIDKVLLRAQAKDQTITYGDMPTNNGVEYKGFVNGEDESVLSGGDYEYSYTQFGDVGKYYIQMSGVQAENYEVIGERGTLTVLPKLIALEWNGEILFYYDGMPKTITAAVVGAVNGDELTIIAADNTQTAAGKYTARVVRLEGEKAGNYLLEEGQTLEYEIRNALDSVAVQPSTVTAEIDGLTIRLRGSAVEEIIVSAPDAVVEDDKLIIHGVTYTIDRSAVDTRRAEIVFTFADGKTQTMIYGAADIGKQLPTDNKSGATFSGWRIGDKTYTALTDEVLTELNGKQQATAVFVSQPSGGSGGGGGAVSTPTYAVSTTQTAHGSIAVTPKSAAKGNVVTVTAKPASGYVLKCISVTDQNGKPVAATEKDGKYTFVMPASKITVEPLFEKETAPTQRAEFQDVGSGAWYADAVRYVAERNLMSGTSDDTFAPESTTTRGMLMTVLARYAGEDTSGGAVWYEKGMAWAQTIGISDGSAPESNITREQLATMLYRYAGSPVVSGTMAKFVDADSISAYAVDAMHWATANGIMQGSHNKLSPKDNATRAQVAAILMRFCKQMEK